MLNRNLKTFIGCDRNYEESDIVLFGAPFDSTASFRPGSRFASEAMRSESFGIESYSPYQERDLCDINVFDLGDLDLQIGDPARMLEQVEEASAEILKDGKIPVMIGGEHLVSYGTISAVFKKHPGLHILHFDAHADLRDEYLGQRLSHASVMRRAWELVGDGKIYQFGIRSGDKSEFDWAKSHVSMHKFGFDGLDKCINDLRDKPVYFTLDLDVLDTSVFPGTGTPEAGGATFIQLLESVLKIRALNIVGCDITELCPVYDQSGASTAAACKILRELLLTISAH